MVARSPRSIGSRPRKERAEVVENLGMVGWISGREARLSDPSPSIRTSLLLEGTPSTGFERSSGFQPFLPGLRIRGTPSSSFLSLCQTSFGVCSTSEPQKWITSQPAF